MRRQYVEADIEVLLIEDEDIVCTSNYVPYKGDGKIKIDIPLEDSDIFQNPGNTNIY